MKEKRFFQGLPPWPHEITDAGSDAEKGVCPHTNPKASQTFQDSSTIPTNAHHLTFFSGYSYISPDLHKHIFVRGYTCKL